MIEVKEEKDIDSLFTGRQTTALVNSIAGLDDFELIAFLVIQETAVEKIAQTRHVRVPQTSRV